jgi:hypothetical protein
MIEERTQVGREGAEALATHIGTWAALYPMAMSARAVDAIVGRGVPSTTALRRNSPYTASIVTISGPPLIPDSRIS